MLDGVYHQVEGRAVKPCRNPIDECQRCGGHLDFFAVIDYDDLNVPLYEEASPRSLRIGDLRSLNVYLCRQCLTINYGISEDRARIAMKRCGTHESEVWETIIVSPVP